MKQQNTKKFIVLTMLVVFVITCAFVLAACGQKQTIGKTIIFDLNDGSPQISKVIDSTDDFIVPTRIGFDFAFWSYDKRGKAPFDPEAELANNTVLYAQWTKKSYTVTFMYEDEVVDTQSVKHDESATSPNMSAYPLFDSWDQDFSHVVSNMTVYAILKDVDYTVQFVVDGQVFATRAGVAGATIPSVAKPTKAGFAFDGWMSNGQYMASNEKFTASKTYTATWTIAAFYAPALLEDKDHPFDSMGTANYIYGEKIEIRAEEIEKFDGITYSASWTVNGETRNTAFVDLTGENVGTYELVYTVTASALGCQDKTASSYATINVEKATLHVSLESISLNYGDLKPTTANYSINEEDLKCEDTEVVINGTLAIQTDYSRGEPCGSYYLKGTGLSASNYVIVYNNSTITVAKKNLTVNLGAYNKPFTGTRAREAKENYAADGLLDNELLTVSIETTAENVGVYSVANDNLDVNWRVMLYSTDISTNYDITFVASLEITPQEVSYTLPQNTTFDFDGTAHFAEVDAPGCNIEYSLDGETYLASGIIPELVNAADYHVYARISRENYATSVADYAITINKANLSVKLQAQSTVYGETFALDQTKYLLDGNTFGEDVSITIQSAYQLGDNVGEYAITASVNASDNFVVAVENSALTVNPKEIGLTIKNASVVYGNAFNIASVEYELVGSLYGEDNLGLAFACEYQVGDGAGTQRTISGTNSNTNYLLHITTALLTVTKRPLSIAVDNAEVVYGNVFNIAGCNYEVTSGILFGSDELDVEYSCDYQQGDNAGETFAIVAVVDNANNYNIEIADGQLTVAKRDVTVSVVDKTVVYGEEFDLSTCEYEVVEGSFYGEAPVFTYTTNYIVGDFGEQQIFAQASDTNHNITINNGILDTTKRNATLVLNTTKAQNGSVFSITFSNENSVLEGAYSGDFAVGVLETTDSANKTYRANGTLGSDFAWPGYHAIKQASGFDVSAYYNLAYDLTVVIADKPIASTKQNYIAEYDGNPHGGSVTPQEADVTIAYSLDGDTYSATNPTFTNVGEHTVYFRLTKAGSTDTFGEFVISISNRKVTIAANDASIEYNAAYAPLQTAYTITSGSFVDPADETALGISLATAYAQGNDSGTYTITLSANALANYDVTIVNGTLTVNPVHVDVTVANETIHYGDARPSFTIDCDAAYLAHFAAVTTYQQGDNTGVYAISVESDTVNCVADLTADATLTVEKRAVTITANDVNTTYGDAPIFSFTATNVYGNDKIVGVTYTCAGVNVGSYSIVPDLADTKNYTFEFANGTLTIGKANLTVTLSQPASITYGDAMPTINVSYSGFKYNDSASSLGGSLAIACAYPANRSVGTFGITGSGFTSSNYNISYTSPTLTVDKAEISITVNQASAITYGDAVPTFSYTATGFKFEDTVALLGTMQYTCAYQQGNNANSTGYAYNVDISGISLANYNVTKGADKKLVVNKANYVGVATPAALNGTYSTSKRLSNYTLGAGYYWTDSTITPTCNVTSYSAYYNADPTNYNNFNLTISLVLQKATATITASDRSVNWESSNNFVSIIGATTNNTDLGASIVYSETSTTYGGTYSITLTVAATTNYTAASKTVTVKIKSVKIGSTYYTLEDALATGGTITLVGNTILSGTNTLASGSTLNLPYDGTNINNDRSDSSSGGPESYYIDEYKESTYLKLKLIITGTLTVNGTLNVGGVTGHINQDFQGHTSGDYTQITLNSSAQLILNGTMNVYGYVKGDGSITINNGATLVCPFVVRDFRGGTSTAGVYTEDNICPFNQFEFPNIQAFQTIYYGATVKANCMLYAGSKYNETTATIIAKSNALLNLTSGYITVKVTSGYNSSVSATDKATMADRFNNKTDIHIYGNATAGSLSLKVTVGIFSKTVDTKSVPFALSYLFDITQETGTLTLSYEYKMLPGSNLTIKSGATLTMNSGGSINVYTNDWVDTAYAGWVYPSNRESAKLTIAGTMNINSGATFGGNVYGENGGQIVVNSSATLTATTKEGYNTEHNTLYTSFGPCVITGTITKTATLVHGDGTTTQMAKGATYNYSSGRWA